MWVLVIFNPETEEVQVRGPWEGEEEAQGAARAYARGEVSVYYNAEIHRLAVVGITPLAYYDPEVHR